MAGRQARRLADSGLGGARFQLWLRSWLGGMRIVARRCIAVCEERSWQIALIWMEVIKSGKGGLQLRLGDVEIQADQLWPTLRLKDARSLCVCGECVFE